MKTLIVCLLFFAQISQAGIITCVNEGNEDNEGNEEIVKVNYRNTFEQKIIINTTDLNIEFASQWQMTLWHDQNGEYIGYNLIWDDEQKRAKVLIRFTRDQLAKEGVLTIFEEDLQTDIKMICEGMSH